MSEEKKYDEVTKKRLEKLRATIEENVVFVDLKPYSHNIIGMALLQISKICGPEEANKCITEFKLEKLGWSKVEE